jgi:hypothetical protein
MLFLQQVCFVRGNGQDAGEGLCGPPPMALPVLYAGFASRFADYQRQGECDAMEK